MSQASQLEQEMGKRFTLRYLDCNDISSGAIESGAAGIYAWYYRPPKDWRGMDHLSTGAPSVREVAGAEKRGGKEVKVRWEYRNTSSEENFTPLDGLNVDFFRYAAFVFSTPIYIGYSADLFERLNQHVRNVRKLCLDSGLAEEDYGEPFTGWLAEYLKATSERELAPLELRVKDFYAVVLSADAAFSVKSINEIEKELIAFFKPLANKK